MGIISGWVGGVVSGVEKGEKGTRRLQNGGGRTVLYGGRSRKDLEFEGAGHFSQGREASAFVVPCCASASPSEKWRGDFRNRDSIGRWVKMELVW